MKSLSSIRRPAAQRPRRPIRSLAGAAVALALTLAACSSPHRSEAANAAARQSAPAATPARENPGVASPALWELKDADTTIYLFGTIHLLKPDTRWFDGAIKNAFDRSDELVMEIVEPDPKTMAGIVGRLAVNTNGPTVSSLLTPEELKRYQAALKQYNLPPEAMDRLDPWMVAITLSVAPLSKLGYDENSGVEKTLTKAAQADGKRIEGLESVEQQLGYFDTLPQKAQIAYLNATVSEMPEAKDEFDALIRSWAAGRPDELARLMNESMEATPDLAHALLFERNARWADWLAQRMDKPGTLFVAVGAGHLAGKDSVIDRLTRRHFTIRRLTGADIPAAAAAQP